MMMPFNDTEEQRERVDKYVDRHYLTKLPESLTQSTSTNYDLAWLEKTVQDKIYQLAPRASKMYMLVLSLFKRCSLNGISRHQEREHFVNIDEYYRVLQCLGVTCPREMSDEMFRKLDTDGNGQLTVQEFLVRQSEKDFTHPWRHKMPPAEMKPPGPAQGGPPLRPMTPECDWTIAQLLAEIRDKIRSNNPSAHPLSAPHCRRAMAQLFEHIDRSFQRYVTPNALKKVLDMLKFPISRHHLALLLEEFPVPNKHGISLFDYPRFIRKCYPEEEVRTSLYMDYNDDYCKMGYQDGKFEPQGPARGSTPVFRDVETPVFERCNYRMAVPAPSAFPSRPPSQASRPPSQTSRPAYSRPASRPRSLSSRPPSTSRTPSKSRSRPPSTSSRVRAVKYTPRPPLGSRPGSQTAR